MHGIVTPFLQSENCGMSIVIEILAKLALVLLGATILRNLLVALLVDVVVRKALPTAPSVEGITEPGRTFQIFE